MKKEPIRWAIVGFGDICQKRVGPAIKADPNSELTLLMRRDEEKAREFAGKFGAERYTTSFEEALGEDIDAVYIATPIYLHKAQTIAAAEKGKHVLCEKPMGMSENECREMIKACKANRVKLGISYYRRFYPKVVRVKELIREGVLGEIILVRIAYYSWYDPPSDDPKAWRIEKSKSGGGPLPDIGSHRLDLLVDFFDSPSKVVALAEALTHDTEVEDSCAALMKLGNGAQATAHFNWNSKTWTDEFEIVGTEGRVEMLPLDGKELVVMVGGERWQEDIPPHKNAHYPLIEDFSRAVLEDREPRVTGEEGLKTTCIIDAVYHSMEVGGWVELAKY